MNNLAFRLKIKEWYQHEKRDLPWRTTPHPYNIWISEVILQQTRIEQGLNYYNRFINTFPDVTSLANAEEETVLKLWQGLGYYSRARNLLKGAKQIADTFNGQFPNNVSDLKRIKGIGDYTAAAIASIAFNTPVATVDGNVYRVLSRIFDIETPIDTTSGKKIFAELANQLLDKHNPGNHNQAVMEFGALHCKHRNPDCNNCIFKNDCIAHNNKIVVDRPIKQKKIKQRDRYFYYLIIDSNNCIYLKKRTNKDIWQNLYDFPLIETNNKIPLENIIQQKEWKKTFHNTLVEINHISKEIIHILSHQKIHVHFIHIKLNYENKIASNFIKIDKKNIFELPMPRLIERYLNENKF